MTNKCNFLKNKLDFLGSLSRRARPQPLDLTAINANDNNSTSIATTIAATTTRIPSINELMAAAVVASSPFGVGGHTATELPSPALYANLYAAATLSANGGCGTGFMHSQSPMLATLAATAVASPLAQAYVAAAAAAAASVVSSPQTHCNTGSAAPSTPRGGFNTGITQQQAAASAAALTSMFGGCGTSTTNNKTRHPHTPHSAALAAACALVANCTQQSPQLFQQQQNTFFQFPPFSGANTNNLGCSTNTSTNSSAFLSAHYQNFSTNLSNFPMALAMLSPSIHALSPYFAHSLATSMNTPSAMSKFSQRSPDALKTPIIKDLSFAFLPQH